VGKATKSDKGEKPDKKAKKKGPKYARPATVLRPVIFGFVLLAAVSAILPKVL
jgi:hypothetical protein